VGIVAIITKKPTMNNNLIPFFKQTAFAEGVSLLLLLGIAMPLKYIFKIDEAVMYTGWVHGILFVAYCFMALAVKLKEKYPFGWLIKAGIAAFLPFGTFVFVKRFLPK
jgi:integral membrane protein